MTTKKILKRIKIKIFCFLIITYLFLTLLFPNIANSQKNQDPSIDYSISMENMGECPKYLIVTLGETDLFCIKDSDNLPDKNEKKYWEKYRDTFSGEARLYSDNLRKFADRKKDPQDLIISISNLEVSKVVEDYYNLPVIYKVYSEYFEKDYNVEIMKIGLVIKTEKNVENQENINEYQKLEKLEQIKNILKNDSEFNDGKKQFKLLIVNAVNNYRESFTTSNSNQASQALTPNNQASQTLKLSNQAVKIRGDILFYIGTWNNGLSPKERAEKVEEKINKIIEGKIDIQGLGLSEKFNPNNQSNTNEESKSQNSKIIEIIIDSKFLSDRDKKIIEVTDNDATFAGVENAETLAQKYLYIINKTISQYKQSSQIIRERGFSVNFLDDELIIINSGEEEEGIYQPSYRASLISKRIETLAQEKFLFRLNKLVAAYPINYDVEINQYKGLCILSESLKQNQLKQKN